jgi:hypothetical protein
MLSKEEEKQKQIIAIKEMIAEIDKDILNITMNAPDIENYNSTGTNPYSETERLKKQKEKLEHDLKNLENGCSNNSGCTVSGGRRYKKKKTIKRRKYTKKNNKSKKSNRK